MAVVYDSVAPTYTAKPTFDAGIKLNDDDEIVLGTGDDAKIDYDGTNLVIDTAAVGSGALSLVRGQIKFPATANLSADANTLDDYEEGEWTPAITFATAGDLSVAYSVQEGRYVKIGRFVCVFFDLVTSTFTHTTASGACKITGLPFTASATVRCIGSLQWQGITKANYTNVVSRTNFSDTVVFILASGSGQGTDTVDANEMPTGGTVLLIGSLVYEL